MLTANLILPLQSSGKMEVTPQQSEILQTELFKMGYAWWYTKEKKINFTHDIYIFWDNYDKGISKDRGNESVFDQVKNPLHLFDNHFKID